MPINRVTIVGNLTRDVDLRTLANGDPVASLRVAVNERRKGPDGEWADAPNFFSVTVFGKAAENAAKFLAKGRQVAVDGRLRWREWQDQQGNKRESIEIVANEVQFIGGRPEGQQPAHDNGQGAWGGQQQTGGFGQGQQYPVTQSDFGQPSQGAPPPQQQAQAPDNWGAPQPTQTGPADEPIPF